LELKIYNDGATGITNKCGDVINLDKIQERDRQTDVQTSADSKDRA